MASPKNIQEMRGHQRIQAAAITLDGCWQTISELAQAGSKPASVKLALWAAILSIQTKLEPNGKQTRVMAPFVHAPLPANRKELTAWLCSGTGSGVMPNQITGLYAVEQLERDGRLPAMPQPDWTLERWQAWASEVEKIFSLGRKTARFAGLLLAPLTCPLLPVDMWVMIRLGYDHDAPTSTKEYRAVEQQVIAERDRNGHSDMPLGAWHWFKWSEIRQECGAETVSERPESHALLSPCWY